MVKMCEKEFGDRLAEEYRKPLVDMKIKRRHGKIRTAGCKKCGHMGCKHIDYIHKIRKKQAKIKFYKGIISEKDFKILGYKFNSNNDGHNGSWYKDNVKVDVELLRKTKFGTRIFTITKRTKVEVG